MTIKHKRILLSIAAILLTGLSGCGSGQLFGPTATPMASSTATPTPLPTLTPTRTPRPTRTPTPTPVPAMRTPISSATWEVTVIGAGSRTILWYSRIGNMLSGWKPKPGNIYLDLAVRIRNLNPSAQRDISRTDLTVTDGNGNDWSVFDFGVAEAGEGKMNPQAIAINQCGSDLCMSPDVVVRLIYVGPKDAITAPFILQFEDVPLIEFEVEGPVG